MSAAIPGLLKVLGDPTRLRILALLDGHELSVGELGRALDMTQSRVSNHLRVLREAKLLLERHAGTSTFLRSPLGRVEGGEAGAPNGHTTLAARLWAPLSDAVDGLPERELDRGRLARVLADRDSAGQEFFDRLATDWDEIGERFESGQGRARAAANLLSPQMSVADLGCGTGYFAEALVGLVSRLLLVDSSSGMLERALERLKGASDRTRVEARVGALDALPIADGELDGVVAGMVLHHLPELEPALHEMRRVLCPGGRAAVLELVPHRQEWMRAALGDRHLGLDPARVASAFEDAGFEQVRLESLDDRYCPTPPAADGAREPRAPERAVSLRLYVVRGRVPSRSRRSGDVPDES